MNNAAFLGKTQLAVFDSVYFPAEDSFLLAKAVKVKRGAKVLDLGCGCGIQSINALQKGAKSVLALDVNEKALENTLLNAKNSGFEKKITVKKSDLFEEVKQKFDLIIFNPPYVESGKRKLVDVDGGKGGREVLDAFLEKFCDFLKENGECFFLQSSLNKISKTEKKLSQKKLAFKIVARKKLFFEELVVFRAWKRI